MPNGPEGLAVPPPAPAVPARLVLLPPPVPLVSKLELLELAVIPPNNGFICDPNDTIAELAVDETVEDAGRMAL